MFQGSQTAAALAGVDACRAFFADCVHASAGRNSLWVAHLDGAARCIHLAAYPGDHDCARLPVREIVNEAAELGSAGMVVARHRAEPVAGHAQADAEQTKHLALAAEAMDVALLDHLVFAADECTSMRRKGLL